MFMTIILQVPLLNGEEINHDYDYDSLGSIAKQGRNETMIMTIILQVPSLNAKEINHDYDYNLLGPTTKSGGIKR